MPPNQPALGPKLGIVAGGGRLPEMLVDHCLTSGRDYFVAIIEGQGDSAAFSAEQSQVFRLGAVGAMIKALKEQSVRELVLAGSVRRPPLKTLMPDWWTAAFLAKTKAFSRGDDGLLRAIVTALEEGEGFVVVGPDAIDRDLLAPVGPIAGSPSPVQQIDAIEHGIAAARDLGARDIGQAVIICVDGQVLEEGAAGTEALIQQGGAPAKGGVLVKVMKPGQERRVDLPAIGPDTIDQAVQTGLAGIVVEAGYSLILDRDIVITKADKAGLFVFGHSAGGTHTR